MIGAGAGQVVSPLASAPFSSKNLVASIFCAPTAQFIGFP